MAYSMFSFRNSISWVGVLVPFSILVSFTGHGVLSISLTSVVVLVLSTSILAFSKQRRFKVDKPIEEKSPKGIGEVTPQFEEVLSENQLSAPLEAKTHVPVCLTDIQYIESDQLSPECSTDVEYIELDQVSESVNDKQKKGAEEPGADQGDGNFLVKSQDMYSESESIEQFSSSEDSEIEWPYSDDLRQRPSYSDDSISDEESLIEIALPSGHVSPEKDPKFSMKMAKFPDLYPETTTFQKRIYSELFADINEEDNMIEIDISIGSIKCPGIEISA